MDTVITGLKWLAITTVTSSTVFALWFGCGPYVANWIYARRKNTRTETRTA